MPIDTGPGRNTGVRALDLWRSRNVLMIFTHIAIEDSLARHELAVGQTPMNGVLPLLALKCVNMRLTTTSLLVITFLEAQTAARV